MRNFVDTQLAYFFNHYVHRVQVVDSLIFHVSHSHLFKGAILFTIMTFAWFKTDIVDNVLRKKGFLMIFVVAILAETIARMVALLAPFRYRPIHDPDLHLQVPYTVNDWLYNHWSSFPSDHMALFSAIALSIYFLHKPSGRLALAYTMIFIGLPRLILGFHFLTDELAGMLIGFVSAWFGYTYLIRTEMMGKLVYFSEKKPAYFYPLLVLFLCQLYEMFEGLRDLFPILRWGLKVMLFE